MAEYKPKSSEESTTEEKIFEKGWLEITKKEFLYGCIGLPFFLAIISAIIVPYLDFRREWDDKSLYDFFELNEHQISIIETEIKPMEKIEG